MLCILFKLVMLAVLTGATATICHHVVANRRMGSGRGASPAALFGVVLATILILIPVFGISAPAAFPKSLFQPFPYILGFFLPVVILTTPLIRKLETSGTNEVETLERALRDCRMLAFFALVYVLLVWAVYLFMAYQTSPERILSQLTS